MQKRIEAERQARLDEKEAIKAKILADLRNPQIRYQKKMQQIYTNNMTNVIQKQINESKFSEI